MEYLILWFNINGDSFATTCSKKNLKQGKVKIYSKGFNNKKLFMAEKNLFECEYLSKFPFSKKRNNYLTWEERHKLFAKYPHLISKTS